MRRVMRVEAREGQRFRRWRGPVLAGLLLSVVWVGGGWAPGGVNAQFVPRQVIAGAYWSLEPGFESSLMLSNTSSEPIRVYPDIYDAGGQGVALARLALREHERRQLDLRRWLAEQGLSFSSGSLRLRHTGGPLGLAAARFMIEFVRGDPGRGAIVDGWLSLPQAMSLGLWLAGAGLRWRLTPWKLDGVVGAAAGRSVDGDAGLAARRTTEVETPVCVPVWWADRHRTGREDE